MSWQEPKTVPLATRSDRRRGWSIVSWLLALRHRPRRILVDRPDLDVRGHSRARPPGRTTTRENPPDSVLAWLENDRFYRWATYLYLPESVPLAGVRAAGCGAGGGWLTMGFVDKLGLMTTVGIDRRPRDQCRARIGSHPRTAPRDALSKIALAQTCYGHFFVEHNRGHHVRVATPEDPASSRLRRESVRLHPAVGRRRRALRVGAGSQTAGRDRRKSRWTLRNDVLNAWLLSVVLFAVLAVWFRRRRPAVADRAGDHRHLPAGNGQLPGALRAAAAEAAQRPLRTGAALAQLEQQHGDRQCLLFHLQRHSDHHANPLRRYQALRHVDEAPQLPSGYSAMLVLALFPPLWRRVMDPRVLDFYGGDRRLGRAETRTRRFGDGATLDSMAKEFSHIDESLREFIDSAGHVLRRHRAVRRRANQSLPQGIQRHVRGAQTTTPSPISTCSVAASRPSRTCVTTAGSPSCSSRSPATRGSCDCSAPDGSSARMMPNSTRSEHISAAASGRPGRHRRRRRTDRRRLRIRGALLRTRRRTTGARRIPRQATR